MFAAVQAKLAANNPRVSPVRAASGPILLTGIATCAHCGGGMTQRTGTSVTGRVYAYYTCATRAEKGPTACPCNTIPMAYLDDLVLRALEERLFTPARLAELLSALAARRSEKAGAHILDSSLCRSRSTTPRIACSASTSLSRMVLPNSTIFCRSGSPP